MDRQTSTVSLRLSPELAHEFALVAFAAGMTRSELGRQIVTEYLEKQRRKGSN